MTPEAIVRALAAADPTAEIGEGERTSIECVLCGGELQFPHGVCHELDCPWRLAVEWVAASRGPHDDAAALEHCRTLARLIRHGIEALSDGDDVTTEATLANLDRLLQFVTVMSRP